MKRLDVWIGILAAGLVIALVVGTFLFRGNIDEWSASLSPYTQDVRKEAEELRETATKDLRPNPDGFYKLELGGDTVVRYYFVWRIRPNGEELPAYLKERLGALAGSGEVDAVGEAASATVHLFSWNNKDRQLLGRWFKRQGAGKVEVEVFAHWKTGSPAWRKVGMLDAKAVGEALSAEDIAAMKESRFNRVVVISSKDAH